MHKYTFLPSTTNDYNDWMMEPQSEYTPVRPVIKSKSAVLLNALVIAMGSLTLGYYLVIASVMEKSILISNRFADNNRTIYLSLITTAFPLGAFLGSLLYNPAMQKINSEVRMMRLCDVGLIFLMLVNLQSLQLEILVGVRLLSGLLLGFSATLVPMYLTSLSPTQMSGRIGSLNQILITVGIAWAYSMNLLLVGDFETESGNWRLCVIMPCLFCVVRISGSFVYSYDLLEKHIARGEDPQLQQYISRIYEQGTYRLEDLVKQKKVEKNDCLKPTTRSSGERKRYGVCLVICFANQFCGINAIIFYTNQIFDTITVGVQRDTILCSVGLGVFQILVTIASGTMMDRFGRRALMILGGSTVCVALLLGYVAGDYFPEMRWLSLVAIFLHIGGFSVSLGPISLLYISEIMQDVSPFMIMIWVETILISLSSNRMIDRMGLGKTFLVYGLTTLVCLCFLYMEMRESKGRPRKLVYEEYQKPNTPLSFLFHRPEYSVIRKAYNDTQIEFTQCQSGLDR